MHWKKVMSLLLCCVMVGTTAPAGNVQAAAVSEEFSEVLTEAVQENSEEETFEEEENAAQDEFEISEEEIETSVSEETDEDNPVQEEGTTQEEGQIAEDGSYEIDFSSVEDEAGWTNSGLSGKGAGRLEKQEDALFMTSNADDQAAGDVAVLNDAAPDYEHGYMEAVFQKTAAEGRIGFLIHSDGNGNQAELIYDGGWKIRTVQDGSAQESAVLSSVSLSNDRKYTIRVEVVNQKLTAVLTPEGEEAQVICEDYSVSRVPQTGKFGFRVWGSDWGNTGDLHYGSMKVYTISMGVLEAEEPTPVPEGEYVLDFETYMGNWAERANGSGGRYDFSDGKMEVQTTQLKGDQYYLIYDQDSPDLASGELSLDVDTSTMVEGRFSFVFRYKDAANWNAVGIDVGGQWRLFTMSNGQLSSKDIFTYNPAQNFNIRIGFADSDLEVYIDDNQVYKNSGVLPAGENAAGKMGIRTWGYDGHFARVIVDNMKYTKTNAVSLNPRSVTLRQAEAGTYDLAVRLSTPLNPFKELTVDQENGEPVALELEKDYTVSEDQLTVTIKKEYLKKIADAEKTTIHFVFQESFTTDFVINIGREEEEFTYSRDFAEGIDGFTLKEGNGQIQEGDGKVSLTGNGIFIDDNSVESTNNEIEFTFDPVTDSMGMGAVLRYAGADQDYLWVGPVSQSSQHETVWAVSTRSGQKVTWPDGYFVLANRGVPYKVKVRVVEDVVTVFVDDAETWTGTVNGLPVQAGKVGFKSGGGGMAVYAFTQNDAHFPKAVTEEVTEETISSGDMTVTVDKEFPRIIKYELADGTGTTGQEKAVNGVEINNTYYTPVVSSDISGDTAVYHMEIEELNVSFDVVFTVTGNVLDMRVTNISDDENPIYTFHFPEQSLVSMSSETGGELRVNNFQQEDAMQLEELSGENTYNTTSIAVLSNGEVAASINNGSDKNRHELAYQTFNLGDHTSTGLWSNEYQYRGLDGEIIEEPWTKVSVTGDRNGDGVVDFQDGAIARRDDCYKDGEERLPGSEDVMRSMNMIAMNVASVAQYPFLRIDDNIKKFYLGTDGFGQNIIIKGYQSEGHDASHPDYANYNKRAGGLEDLNTLIEDSKQYNANIGVHINDTDIYPEAPQYAEKASSLGAWSWYDSSRQIIRVKDDLDTSEDGFDARINQLFADTNHDLSTVYVDVFFGTRWPMYKVTSNIQNDGHGVATEYVDEMIRTSVFAHHIDNRFNGAGNLVRFIYNEDKDIFGASNLFRGASDRTTSAGGVGFLGWQGATNYNQTIESFYTKVLPNKFLGQYPISQYTSDTMAVLGDNNEVVTKMEGGRNVITLDGKTVADGNNIFIPWTTGEGETAQEKIYFWTSDGAHTTWDLPEGWTGESTVTVYPLSDQGKGKGVTVKVAGGQVTIPDAVAKQAYVIYRGGEESKITETASTMEWSTGSYVKDMGFDSHDFDNWEKSSTSGNVEHITISNNNLGNSGLCITGTEDGKVTQTLTGLEEGKTYSASVWMNTSEGKRAVISVDNGETVVSNYIDESNLRNGTTHNDKMGTNDQRVAVHFTATSDTAVLTLEGAAGTDAASVTRFDDVRVVENEVSDKGSHTYYEDFENVDQGYGPFIVTQTADNTHLSELNDKNPEATPDVLDGRYSLKVRSNNYIRTAPFTVRFQPDTEYTIGFEYKVPSGNGFTVNVKSDETGETLASADSVNNNQISEIKLNFTTGNADDYYVEVVSKGGSEYYIDNFWADESSDANLEKLQTYYDKLSGLKEEDYTPESFADLQTALTAAKEVLDKGSEASAEEINAAYEQLTAAEEGLEGYATAEERQALQKVLDEMKALPADDYQQDEKWDAFQAAIKEAEALLKEEKITGRQTVEMINKLQAAEQELTYIIDRSELQALVSKGQAVDQGAMTDGADLQSFKTALDEAAALLTKPGVTKDEIDAMCTKLEKLYQALIPKVEQNGQEWKQNYVKDLTELASGAEESWFASEDDYQAFLKAQQQMDTVMQDTTANLGAIDAAKEELQKALDKRNTYTISVSAAPEEGGEVSGGKDYRAGETATVKAEAAEGFLFKGWYQGEEKVSDEASYTFAVAGSLELTAHFEGEQSETPEDIFQKSMVSVEAQAKDYDSVTVTWEDVENADGYYVYYAEAGVTGWIRKGEVAAKEGNSYTFDGLKTGTRYLFTVKGFWNSDDYGMIYTQYKTDLSVTPVLEKTNVRAESVSPTSVEISWDKVAGADKYFVYRKDMKEGAVWERIASTAATSFIDKNAKCNTTYYYTAKAVRNVNGVGVSGAYPTDVTCRAVVGTTKVDAVYAGGTSVKISWDKVTGANGYWVYRKGAESGATWERIGVTTANSYIDTKGVYGKTYYYTAKAYAKINGEAVFGAYPTDVTCKLQLSQPKVSAFYDVSEGVQINWSKVEGASGYWVYRKGTESGAKWERIAAVTGNSFKDTKAVYGKTYYYTAKAYTKVNGEAVFGTYPTNVTCKVMLKAPNVTVSSTKEGTVDITWNKVDGATGYIVYRNRAEAGSTWERITLEPLSASSFSCTDSYLESGHTYYFTVKAIKTENGKTLNGDYLTNVKIEVK